ncbi:hypothetical protein BDN71DRAFT_1433244 [Pleurotus eryngii]|uniref:Uncharacterized protein n=1 Tax=Pleurotus eryngii TaxID=5323 RepID=A0A9P6D608_PLEER|nr:hypothetical protein BDN71DRAFT_1433244 [Pleurotus eryngii]
MDGNCFLTRRDSHFVPVHTVPSTRETFIPASNGNSAPFLTLHPVSFPPLHIKGYPTWAGHTYPAHHQPLLDHGQLRSIRFAVSNILVKAFISGGLLFLNDKTLRRTVKFHLGWQGNSLISEQAQFVVYQTRCRILFFLGMKTYLEEAAMSPTVRFAILGIALGPICRHLQQ